MSDLVETFQLNDQAIGHLTSAVQFGFILGTFLFALLAIADRFAPSHVFMVCAILGALSNLALNLSSNTYFSLLVLRVSTGFFLAGIYPIGMKIAADYFDKGLGKSLGYLVGALVVGTGFPHLLNGLQLGWDWQNILTVTSGVATLGGIAMFALVPDGPYRKKSQQFDLKSMGKVFKKPAFRSAAFGYFGHMWELYTFWAFVPVLLTAYILQSEALDINTSLWSFMIIGMGGFSCVVAGYLSFKKGARWVATIAISASGICCLVTPVVFSWAPPLLFFGFLIFWGWVVIADSPMFSTLVAQEADPDIKGTALTIVNSIGFAITIVSIQLISSIYALTSHPAVFMILALGPAIGLYHLRIYRPTHV